MNTARSALLLLVTFALAACATPGTGLTDSVGSIRSGLEQVRRQSGDAFESTNETALQIDVERVIAGPAPNLREEDFPVAIAYEEQAKWANAFAVLDDYLAAVQRLVDPERAAVTAQELDGIASRLSDGNLDLQLPGAATGAFASFAGALVQAKAERTAIDIMRQVDPAFQQVMIGMANAIGADDRAGLRQTVRLYWQGKLSDARAGYVSVSGAGEEATEQRRIFANQFVQAMQGRDADLRKLAAMRGSIVSLGGAHRAAAEGDAGNALFWVSRIGG